MTARKYKLKSNTTIKIIKRVISGLGARIAMQIVIWLWAVQSKV